MSLPAVVAAAVLDRVTLEVPAQEWRIRRMPLQTLHEVLGGRRLGLPVRSPGATLRQHLRRISLSWSHVGSAREVVEDLLEVPGVHELILWRYEPVAWRGDGARTVYSWPNGWIPALDTVASPDGLPAALFASRVRVGYDGDPLTAVAVDTATFDGAPGPDAGEVWTEEEGSRIRLAAPPASGEIIHGRVVPVYRVLEHEETEVRLTSPIAEPRELRFEEAT